MRKMLCIFIGYNNKHLQGCENDAIIFNNLIKKNFVDSETILLTGKKVTVLSLIKIFKKYKDITNLFIYFSGHGYLGGNLDFSDKILNPLELYELINTYFNNYLKLFLILDCCYSGSFPLIDNFQKIKSVSIIASCKDNQKSSEIIIKNINNETYILGAFTFNLIKLIKQNNLYDIDKWFCLENYPIWEKLEKLINQKITIIR